MSFVLNDVGVKSHIIKFQINISACKKMSTILFLFANHF